MSSLIETLIWVYIGILIFYWLCIDYFTLSSIFLEVIIQIILISLLEDIWGSHGVSLLVEVVTLICLLLGLFSNRLLVRRLHSRRIILQGFGMCVVRSLNAWSGEIKINYFIFLRLSIPECGKRRTKNYCAPERVFIIELENPWLLPPIPLLLFALSTRFIWFDG